MRSQDGLGLIAHTQVRGDPTHTLTLRRAYSAQMTKRFRALKGAIRQSLIDNDALGLKNKSNNQSITNAPPSGKSAEQIKGQFSPIPARRFDFARSTDKIEGFMEWLDQQQKQGILEVTQQQQIGQAIENQWQNTYIRSAYQKGILRARQEMQNAGYTVPDVEDVGGINAVFNQPFHADRVGSIFTRAFNELKGITDAMDQQISRALAEGISRGDGPEVMARAINDRVDKVGLSRARTMARTEAVRSHHNATIQEYRNAGVEGVKVKAEWSTAGDSRVCELCKPLEGHVFDLDTIEGMIPRHPNCRCCALPVDVTETEEEVEEEAVKEVEPRTKSVDELRQDYDQAKTDYDQALKDNPVGELVERRGLAGAELEKTLTEQDPGLLEHYRKMKRAEYTLAEQIPEEELLRWKRQKIGNALRVKIKNLSKKEIKGIEQEMEDGISHWCPYDILDEMVGAGWRVHVFGKNKVKRAFYQAKTRNVAVNKDSHFVTFGHEWSHAVDDFFSREMPFWAQGSRTTGGAWVDNKYVTKSDGENFQGWFFGNTSGEIGQYRNGDGQFHKNNWIDSYEGRKYEGRAGVGQEWWAMNMQRYACYRKFSRAADEGYSEKLKLAQEDIDSARSLLDTHQTKKQEILDELNKEDIADWRKADLSSRLKGTDNLILEDEKVLKRREEEYDDLQSLGKQEWAARKSDWKRARESYPNLTNFIEQKFNQRIAGNH